ncbi:MAG: hypothetical protein AAFN91_12280 [Pseudomonadota bacterium]
MFAAWALLGWGLLIGFPESSSSAPPEPRIEESEKPEVVTPPEPESEPEPEPEPTYVEVSSGVFVLDLVIVESLDIPEGTPVEVHKFDVKTDAGASGSVDVFLLFDRAVWRWGKSDQYIDTEKAATQIEDILDSSAFANEADMYDALVCLGTESSAGEPTNQLAKQRALDVCNAVASRNFVDHDLTKVYGLPIGIHEESGAKRNSKAELRERGVIILGVKGAPGEHLSEDGRNRMVRTILEQDLFVNRDTLQGFKLSSYSRIQGGQPLEFVRVSYGAINRE